MDDVRRVRASGGLVPAQAQATGDGVKVAIAVEVASISGAHANGDLAVDEELKARARFHRDAKLLVAVNILEASLCVKDGVG